VQDVYDKRGACMRDSVMVSAHNLKGSKKNRAVSLTHAIKALLEPLCTGQDDLQYVFRSDLDRAKKPLSRQWVLKLIHKQASKLKLPMEANIGTHSCRKTPQCSCVKCFHAWIGFSRMQERTMQPISTHEPEMT
jgi:integrase